MRLAYIISLLAIVFICTNASAYVRYPYKTVQSLVVFTETDTPKVKLPYPLNDYYDFTAKSNSRLDFQLPKNINTEFVYNPDTGMYEVYQKIGSQYYRQPTALTLEEYMAYQRQKALNDYFVEKVESENAADQNLIPPLNVKGEAFDMIFGGDEINIRPQGSAEISFGVNINKYENPALPIRQQRQTQFDFDQQIQMNLVGQIGDKLKLEIAQNTSGTGFNFQNQVKIGYTGYEDEIIQKIEAGNVTLPLNTTLIQGSQSLFGIRTDLKFGKLTVNTLLSQQKGQRQEINVAGGAQQQEFEVRADNYEENKHYFLNFYHRENYDSAMASMPYVSSGVNITKIEVYVTNRNNNVENTRNFIAFTDLGENKADYLEGNPTIANIGSDLPDNNANNLYAKLTETDNVRGFSNAVDYLTTLGQTDIGPLEQAFHYEKVENAKRLSEQEFNYNALLGYISLRQSLNQDEVLAVAYQYTYQGKTYQVGEFSNDVPVESGSKSALILKLLKPTIVNPKNKLWDLMMKNVYSLGAYQVGPTNFRLDIWYNNPRTSVDVNFFPYDGVDDKMLLQYLDLDRLNLNTERQQDGRFDFVPFQIEGNRITNGGTIDARTGRIFFATVEPFGTTLREKMEAVESPLPSYILEGIVYQELYDSTRTAAQQLPDKNRFKIKGTYESSVSSDIPLNALNIPEGSVTVTAGGATLIEGVDYQVDYNLGRVKILNEGILESQTPIKVQLESNSGFGFQQKSLVGAHFNYEFNKDFNWGATVMNLTEKPVTQKVNIGSEPVSNTVLGTDIRYRAEVPFITKMVDFLPVISTKEKSYITASGEFAYLIPGTQRAIGEGGISYIDGFEGSQSAITLITPFSWVLSSIPQFQPTLFPEASIPTGTASGFNRSKLAWYTIDQTFYFNNSRTPDHLRGNDTVLEDSRMRILGQQELFPQTQIVTGQANNIQTLDLAYYPQERGPYNYDTTDAFINQDGTFNNPTDRWAGIMRALTTTNFETANVQYIQFWMMDPYNNDATDTGKINLDPGTLYFNLGNISEDILPDSRKSYENGLPTDGIYSPNDYDSTDWGIIANQQVIVNAFDNNNASRQYQDLGLDGLNNAQERAFFANYTQWLNQANLTPEARQKLLNDVSSDGYNYFLDDDYDAARANILERYKDFNGHEGNSNTSEISDTLNADGYPTQRITTPDIEDINVDNNLSETENYFQYKVDISPNSFVVGQNYITNSKGIDKDNDGIDDETWYQFKIPIAQPQAIVNNISDFRSIRFMRMYVKGFENPKVFRFATLELIRGTWREYLEDLQTGDAIIDDPNSTEFVIGAVNLEENEKKEPVGYIIPDGIQRENDFSSLNTRQLNEQSMTLEVCGLKDGDSRAAYKNMNIDIRNYGQIQMFIHAETASKIVDENLVKDNDLTVFVRLGTDFTQNYYEYEVPLKLTPWGTISAPANATVIWPQENNVNIILDDLIALKIARDEAERNGLASSAIPYTDTTQGNKYISVRGNPTLSEVKTIMVGVRNPNKKDNPLPDDGLEKCAEIWVNELRMTNFKQNGGYAATAQVNVQMADFGNVAVSGNYSTPDWGTIESKVVERQRETISNVSVNSNFELGQFFGEKIGIRLPAYFGYSIGAIDPEYNPLSPDVQTALIEDPQVRQEINDVARALTIRRSYNFTNVRKERAPGKEVHFWDVENLSLSYSYNELYRRDINTQRDITKNYKAGVNYAYSGKPKLIEPFKEVGFISKSKWLRLVKDFNFYLGPKSFSVNNNIQRMYNVLQNRNSFAPEFVFTPTYYKTFTWNRAYTFKYDITKNLKFNYSAINASIIREPQGEIDSDAAAGTIGRTNYNRFTDIINTSFNPFAQSTSDSIKFGGYNMSFGQQFDINYKVPFDKLPLTDWISATATYNGAYDWMRAPIGQDSLGNTIQNSRTFNINGQLNFISLYNKVPYFQKINRGNRGAPRTAARSRNVQTSDGDKEDAKKDDGDDKKKKDKDKEIGTFGKTVG
ncbi:MAG: cell surface protein SprA, partial [Putridiphycobacter sp.]|nr:cell surface protein SprA [Putridiphycobacter sp.]